MRTPWHSSPLLARTCAGLALASGLVGASLPARGQGADAAPPAAQAPAEAASTPGLMRWGSGLNPGAQQGMAAMVVMELPDEAEAPAAPAPAPARLNAWPRTDAADALSIGGMQPVDAPSTPEAPEAPSAPASPPPPETASAPAPAPASEPAPATASTPAPEPGPSMFSTQPQADNTPGEAHLHAPNRPALGLHARGKTLGSGIASWYGPGFHGRLTANGERFDMNAMTAAHKTLPFGTRVLVHNPRTGKQVVVRINDRGPFVKGRVIDLSRAAATALGLKARGHDQVVLHELPREGAAAPGPGKTTAQKTTAKPANTKARAKAKTPARPASAAKTGTKANQKR